VPNFLTGITNSLSLTVGHQLIRSRPDDRYVVSYPRSGNTWLRTMLAYIIEPESVLNPEWRNSLILGVSIRKAEVINRLPSPRLIKSHTWYHGAIPKAIYLTRDGRDVLISFYHYHVTRHGRTDIPFNKFFEYYCHGYYGHQWHKNIETWLTRGKETMGENLRIVRFEDLKLEPSTTLQVITRFLDLPATDAQIQNAIQASSLEQMRKIEKERRGILSDSNQSFYRGGKTGEWKDYFSPDINTRFLEMSSRALHLAGYDQ